MKSLILGLILSSAFAAHADMFTRTLGSKQINGVTIATSAKAAAGSATVELTTAGAGLRAKRVIVDVPVYVAELYLADTAKFERTEAGALASLAAQPATGIRLNFVRNVEAKVMVEAFLDSFTANGISDKDADVAAFLNLMATSGDSAKNGALNILVVKEADGSETVYFENVAGGKSTANAIKTGAGMTAKIFSAWLGETPDGGLAKLKAVLISGEM